jgi:threonyl-tRNA synthetase
VNSESNAQLKPVFAILKERGALPNNTVAAHLLREGAPPKIVDLHTPVPEDSKLEALPATHPDALAVIRHSSAHVMADAVQRLFPGTKVAFGPATDNGFYYDYDKPGGPFTDEDLRLIEKKMAEIVSADLRFTRENVSPEQAREILQKTNETYKLEHLERLVAQGEEISLYKHGEWVDLCEGPHVPSTRYLKAFQLTMVAGAYWRGVETNPMLQRIYGTAFADKKALEDYLKQLEEAKKRDHRKLGKELELVTFHPWAPASPFFLPRGAAIYNALIEYVRKLYVRFDYIEVITPQIFDRELFVTSGHLPAYAENMFLAASKENVESVCEHLAAMHEKDGGKLEAKEVEKALLDGIRFGVKPMNCPAHALMFGSTRRSYRELPMRVADFGRLHRFERSGVTQGLTRVRTFCQDDGHIFCALDQVQSEIESFVDLVYAVYKDFEFSEVRVVIATRPDVRIGADEIWDKSERALIDGVEAKGLKYEIAPGEGAFYGPKIEFHLKDAIGRSWQLGTMQADFNMAERFDLSYVGVDNAQHRPVALHRAILGSIERFFGVLIEHVSGSFPTWLAPEQITLLTVSEKFDDHAKAVLAKLKAAGIRAVADLSGDKLGAKIRVARNMRIPYRAVVGEKEVESGGLSISSRDENKDLGMMSLDEVIAKLGVEGVPPSLRAS